MSFSMNNENLREPERANLDPVAILMGVQGQVRCFYGNEKFKQFLKDVLNAHWTTS